MTVKHHIAVLTHELDRFQQEPYLMRFFLEHWRAEGFEVQVMSGLDSTVMEADIGIMHVDLTVTPDPYIQFMIGPTRWINGQVTNISKRSFSSLLLERDSGYVGPVIVKTDCNFGGIPEHLAKNQQSSVDNPSVAGHHLWEHVDCLDPSCYPIFDSVHRVPEGIWSNRHLVVEKFLVERDDDLFCLRSWVFFGDREISKFSRSKQPVVKANSIVDSRVIEDVPDELRRIRAELGFDFGKFDYGVIGDEVILYDVNRTPTASAQITPEKQQEILDRLAPGIQSYL